MRIPGLSLEIDDKDLSWRATDVPGVSWLPLSASGAGKDTTALIRMEPGHGYPPHRHTDVEEVLVLAGGYRDDQGTHEAGSYVRYEAGSVHAPVAVGNPKRPGDRDHPACILYAVARGGVELLGRS